MKLFKKDEDDFSTAPLTAFEELVLGKKEKGSPVIKGTSAVLYITVIIAVLACAFMAALDFTGKTAVSTDGNTKTTDTIDASSLPESLQKLYKENFEAADFVSSYPQEKDKVKKVSLKAYKGTNQMPLFIQWDKQWGYLTYGNDLAGVNADGPMCLAMVGYYLTGDEKFSPDKIIAFSQEKGFFNTKYGSSPSLFIEGANELGLKGAKISSSNENFIANLQNGWPIVCYIGQGKFTSTPHYIVISGYNDSGLIVNDPNSIINSQKQWQFSELAEQIKGAWTISVAG